MLVNDLYKWTDTVSANDLLHVVEVIRILPAQYFKEAGMDTLEVIFCGAIRNKIMTAEKRNDTKEKRVHRVEIEDANGKWNDNWKLNEGYRVSHRGIVHVVFEDRNATIFRGEVI